MSTTGGTKRAIVARTQRWIVNPPVRALLRLGVLPPTHALLETTGRRTGLPRQTPVGNGLTPDRRTFWVVAEHGRAAAYVRNLLAEPRVRVRVGRRWHTGTAHVVDDDDPVQRLQRIGRPVNGFMVRSMGTDLLSIRVDLDETPAGG